MGLSAGCASKSATPVPAPPPVEPVANVAPINATAAVKPHATGTLRDRHVFAAKLAKVKKGMKRSEVEALLGQPDDVRTQRDPGGISATRTVNIWRYGTRGHLTFPTLGSVHFMADDTVQYIFGGRDKPAARTLMSEPALRRLLRMLDRVPSTAPMMTGFLDRSKSRDLTAGLIIISDEPRAMPPI